jgi:hypothetical protein
MFFPPPSSRGIGAGHTHTARTWVARTAGYPPPPPLPSPGSDMPRCHPYHPPLHCHDCGRKGPFPRYQARLQLRDTAHAGASAVPWSLNASTRHPVVSGGANRLSVHYSAAAFFAVTARAALPPRAALPLPSLLLPPRPLPLLLHVLTLIGGACDSHG